MAQITEALSVPPRISRRIILPIVLIGLICLAIGGVGGYGVGSTRATHAVVSDNGWLLQSVEINGITTPVEPDEEIFIWWDIHRTPHNPSTDWLTVTHALVTPPPIKTKLKTPTPTPTVKVYVNGIKVNALDDGQGNVAITGDACSVNGTRIQNTITLTIPPNCLLFPEQANFFRTLVFISSTLTAFNRSIIQVQ